MSLGLIIQGPVLSLGRAGDTLGYPAKKIDKTNVVSFDCSENINIISERCASFFHSIVLVTWKNQDVSKIKLRSNFSVQIIEDNTEEFKLTGRKLIGGNQLKQFLSIQRGVEFLSKKGCDYCIKVRTDQNLDIPKLADFVKETLVDSKDLEKIIVPHKDVRRPDYIQDFYFASNIYTLNKLCNSILNGYVLSGGIHRDIYYKSLLYLLPEYIPLKYLFQKNGKYQNYLWGKVFIPGPRDVWESIVWRGKKSETNPSSKFYRFFENDFICSGHCIKNRRQNVFLIEDFYNFYHGERSSLFGSLVLIYLEMFYSFIKRLLLKIVPVATCVNFFLR